MSDKVKTKSDVAVKAEASGKRTATVEWEDLDPFEVPIYRNDWSFDAMLAAEEGQRARLLVALLPPEALAQFRANRRTAADAFDLLDVIGVTMGLADAGESSASAT